MLLNPIFWYPFRTLLGKVLTPQATMNLIFIVAILADLSRTVYCLDKSQQASCNSPQYLEFQKTGTIICSFPPNFGIFWYNTSNFLDSEPIVLYQRYMKSGVGYDSGHYDVYPNGSLVIRNVSLHHDLTFYVACVYSETEQPRIIGVRVIVMEKPSVPFPVFEQCGNASNICYFETYTHFLQCSVRSARPNVTLQLIARTVVGDKRIPHHMLVSSDGFGYTTLVTTSEAFLYSPSLTLLVCKASSPPGMLENDESLMLAHKKNFDIFQEKRTSIFIQRNTRVELNCTEDTVGFVVWRKMYAKKNKYFETLIFALLIGSPVTITFVDGIELGRNGSLIVQSATAKHEGVYVCDCGDGFHDYIAVYDVAVFVRPQPPYPTIDGCSHQKYCVLLAEHDGSLTCKVTGIRPQVQLKLQTVLESDSDPIYFTNEKLSIKERGDTYDVTVTSTYHVVNWSKEKITIECKVLGPAKVFDFTTKMDLVFAEENVNPTDQLNPSENHHILGWVIAVVLVLLFISCAVAALLFKLSRKRLKPNKKEGQLDELSPIFEVGTSQSGSMTGKMDQFVKQLTEKYKDLYNAVQPIPYIRDRMYCVEKVFVEEGIEFMVSRSGVEDEHDNWERLHSYQSLFNDAKVKSTRRILEGEPGYGKSTVSLQFAYDWCKSSPDSALQDVEILIFLRLRQLSGVTSVYKAIKQFLLPKDSQLTEQDIEGLLRNSKSIVILLDGFDEYPDRDCDKASDFIDIIERNMFQESEVVLTTRPSFLPKSYPPQTKRIRLTGFDESARRYYIQKAVVGKDEDKVQEVEGYLRANPILGDLCQVPLLFVIFAHMTYESEQFRKLNSVTSFFRYMISCFHSHMENKMENKNVSKLFQNHHSELDRVAFEGFSGKSQKIVWRKEIMCDHMGKDFYDQYIRVGILVEEDVIDINDDPGSFSTEHVQHRKEVRFYHKLFCEWYAAHYLSTYVELNPTVNMSEFLKNLDPVNVQYMYRFACGLNSKAGEQIIAYLNDMEGGDKFAILCILEQTGEIDHIKETVQKLCLEGVVISRYDSLLLQRSSIQLLEIAARNDIPISYVGLHCCVDSVDEKTETLITDSGLHFPVWLPIKNLRISFSNKDITSDESETLLKFASRIDSLERLWFTDFVPFKTLRTSTTLSTLQSRSVQVYWQLFGDCPKYKLSLSSGKWEDCKDFKEIADADFDDKVCRSRKQKSTTGNIPHTEKIKRHRQDLRKLAKKKASSTTGPII